MLYTYMLHIINQFLNYLNILLKVKIKIEYSYEMYSDFCIKLSKVL